jgi:hypothetical protein
MLDTATLTYRATVTLDEARREVAFSELLAERGTGISSGGDDGESSGFGFETTSHNTQRNTIADTIEDQARQYSRHYALDFPYARVREIVGQIATAAGYGFRYRR